MDDRLDRFLAVDQPRIRDVVYRYCRAVDRMDQQLLRECFHPDARDHHGDLERDLSRFIEWCWSQLQKFDSTMHFVGNVLIEPDPHTEHRARSEAYAIAYHTKVGGPAHRNLEIGLRYVDLFEWREDGGWRILHRRGVTDWARVIDQERTWAVPADYLLGARSEDDPVYDW